MARRERLVRFALNSHYQQLYYYSQTMTYTASLWTHRRKLRGAVGAARLGVAPPLIQIRDSLKPSHSGKVSRFSAFPRHSLRSSPPPRLPLGAGASPMVTPTTNPFPALQGTLQSKMYLNHTPSYHTQLWVMTGVYAASLLLTIAALLLRIRRGGFWLYRMHATAYGSWIIPNAMVCWLFYSGVFQVCELRPP